MLSGSFGLALNNNVIIIRIILQLKELSPVLKLLHMRWCLNIHVSHPFAPPSHSLFLIYTTPSFLAFLLRSYTIIAYCSN